MQYQHVCIHLLCHAFKLNIVIEVYSNFCLLLKSIIESKNISKLVKQPTLEKISDDWGRGRPCGRTRIPWIRHWSWSLYMALFRPI